MTLIWMNKWMLTWRNRPLRRSETRCQTPRTGWSELGGEESTSNIKHDEMCEGGRISHRASGCSPVGSVMKPLLMSTRKPRNLCDTWRPREWRKTWCLTETTPWQPKPIAAFWKTKTTTKPSCEKHPEILDVVTYCTVAQNQNSRSAFHYDSSHGVHFVVSLTSKELWRSIFLTHTHALPCGT